MRHIAVGKRLLTPVADHGLGRVLVVLALCILVGAFFVSPTRAEAPPHIGYGTTAGETVLGFDWVKTLHSPAAGEARRLVRIDLRAPHLERLDEWLAELRANVRSWENDVDAYEIGNEPNLDVSYGWDAPPNAADYAYGLCRAYATIKAADPDALVVTAGLATTGRIPFQWQGHKGYCAPGTGWCPAYYQDEREFLREMLQAGAGACFDALGTHPFGFNAPYDAAPGSAACGPNDFCFRSVESIHTILHDEFGLSQPIWATEFGWIVDPRQVGRAECWDDPTMAGFQWMVVSPEVQAANLIGAYQYAETHYPWMGAMFFFNYGIGVGCDQIGFFNVHGRPAEDALKAMPKRYVPSIAAWPGERQVVVDVGATGVVDSRELWLDNLTYGRLSWQAAIVPGSSLDGRLSVQPAQGGLGQPARVSIDVTGLAPGRYVGRIALSVTAPLGVPVERAQQEHVVRLFVVSDRTYLPIVSR